MTDPKPTTPSPPKFEPWPKNKVADKQSSRLAVGDTRQFWSLDGIPIYQAQELRNQLDEHGREFSHITGNFFETTVGRRPARGQVILGMEQAEYIRATGSLALHKLVMFEGADAVEFSSLVVTEIRSAGGTWVDPTKGLTKVSAVIVGLSDIRWLGSRVPVVDSKDIRPFGALPKKEPDKSNTGQPIPSKEPEVDPWESIRTAWAPLKGVMGDLKLHESLSKVKILPPVNVLHAGVNAWDAFNDLVDSLGLVLTVLPDGTVWIYGYEAKIVAGWPTTYRPRLLEDFSRVMPHGVPAKITVAVPAADYQWQKSTEGHTDPLDWWRKNSVYRESWKPSELGAPLNVAVLPGTEDQIAAPWVADFDPDRKVANKDKLSEAMKGVAKQYLQSLLTGPRWMDQEFHGLCAFVPGPECDAVRFTHTDGPGRGVRTRVAKLPFVPSESWTWNGPAEQPGEVLGPFNLRKLGDAAEPVDKWFLGVLAEKASDGLAGASSDKPVTSFVEGAKCRVAALAGLVKGTSVAFTRFTTVDAWNCTGTTLAAGRRVLVQWNYQLETGGAWCITAAAGKEGNASDFMTMCPGLRDLAALNNATNDEPDKIEQPFLDDPGTIRLNHASMLRMFHMINDVDAREPFIELQIGPPHTVLWSGAGAKMAWSADPILTRVEVTNGVDFINGPGSDVYGGLVNVKTPRVTVWNATRNSITHNIGLPDLPRRSGAYLIADGFTSPDTELGWHGPGWDLSIVVPTQLRCFCEETASGCMCRVEVVEEVGLIFRNGLLMQASQGELFPAKPVYQKYVRKAAPRFNPCYDAGAVSVDEPAVPDPQPTDPDPRPQGPGTPWQPNPIIVDFPDDVRQSGLQVVNGKMYLNGKLVWGGTDIISP